MSESHCKRLRTNAETTESKTTTYSSSKKAWVALCDFAEKKGISLIDEETAPRNSAGRIEFRNCSRDNPEDIEYFETKSCGKAYRKVHDKSETVKDTAESKLFRDGLKMIAADAWWKDYIDDILFYILYYGENGLFERPDALTLYEQPEFENLDLIAQSPTPEIVSASVAVESSMRSDDEKKAATIIQSKMPEIGGFAFSEEVKKSPELQGCTVNAIVFGLVKQHLGDFMPFGSDGRNSILPMDNVTIYAFAGKVKVPGRDYRIRGESYQQLKQAAIACTLSNKFGQYRLVLPINTKLSSSIYTVLFDFEDTLFINGFDSEGYFSHVTLTAGTIFQLNLDESSRATC